MSDASGSGFFPPLPSSPNTGGSFVSSASSTSAIELSLSDILIETLPSSLRTLQQTVQINTQITRVTLPPSNQDATLYRLVLNSAEGDIILNSRLPLQARQQMNLTLEPGSPVRLSQIKLIAPQNRIDTPIVGPTAGLQNINSPNNSLPLNPLRVGGLVEALVLQNIQSSYYNSSLSSNTADISNLTNQGSAPQSATPNPFNNTNLLPALELSSAHNLGQHPHAILRIAHFTPPASGLLSSLNGNIQAKFSQNVTLNLTSTTNANAPLLKATVIAHTTNNTPVLQSSAGSILILTNTNLPVGSQIAFQILTPQSPSTSSALQNSSVFNQPFNVISLIDSWPALEELIALTSQQNSGLSQILQNQIPALGRPISSLILLFFAALQVGENAASAWLGQQLTQNIRNMGHDRLLNQLERDFQSTTKIMRETTSGQEFRSITLPFQTQENIQPIHFIIRHTGEQQNNEQDEKKQENSGGIQPARNIRFLVNLRLSRLGSVQIDGLLKNKNMDIALRLEHGLPESTRYQMNERYQMVLESLGLQGRLLFQTTDNWVHFQDEASPLSSTNI